MPLNPNLPLGLPDGSIRGLIAIWFSGVTGFLWASSQVVPSELLLLTTTIVTFYFATRTQESTAQKAAVAAVEEVTDLAPPYIPSDHKET